MDTEPSTVAALAGRGIHHRFGALSVLDGVDFALAEREAVGVVGPNGAGKTTLLNVLAGALRPASGSVWFAGTNVTAARTADRCRMGIARTHQVPRPFGGMTVFENVYVAVAAAGRERGSERYRRCLDALSLCRLDHLANRDADRLGLLDRKRLELARALGTGPTVLLLDEIGGGLSDAEGEELVGMITALRERGIAIVWIEHIVHLLMRVVDRLVCMDAGRVIADGEPEAVLGDAAVIDAYLGGTRSAG